MARKDLITGGLLIYSVWIVGFRCNSIDIGDEGIGLTVKHGSDGFTHLDVSNLESQSKLGTISLKLMDNSNSNGHMSGNVNENLLNIFQSNSKPASTKIIRKTVVKSSKVPPGNEVYRFPNGLNSRTRARTNTLHIRNNRIAQRTSQSNQAPRLTRTMIQNSRTSSNVSQRNVPQRNVSHRVSNMFVNNKLTKNRKEQILSKKVTTNTRNDSYKPIYGAVKSITSNKTFKYNQHQQKHNLPFPTQISQYTTNNQYRTINYFTNNWIKITVHNIHLLRNPNVKIIKVGENIYVKAKTPAEKAKPTNNSNRVPIQPKSMPTPTINRKIPPKQNKIISRKMNNLDIIPKLDPVKNVVKKPHPRVKPSKISTKIVSTKTNRYIPRKVNNSVKILKKTQKTREPRKITVNTVTNPVKSFFIRTPSGKLIKVKTTGKTTHNRQASIPNEKTNTSTNSRRKNVVPSVKVVTSLANEMTRKTLPKKPLIPNKPIRKTIQTTKTIVLQPNRSVPQKIVNTKSNAQTTSNSNVNVPRNSFSPKNPNLDPRSSNRNSMQPNNPTEPNSNNIVKVRRTNNPAFHQKLPTVSNLKTNAKEISTTSHQTTQTNQVLDKIPYSIFRKTVENVISSPDLKKTPSPITNSGQNVRTATNNQISSVKVPASMPLTNTNVENVNTSTNKPTPSNVVSNLPISSRIVLKTPVDKPAPANRNSIILNIKAVNMTNSALPVEPNPTNTNPVTTITSNPAKDLTNQVVNMNKQKSPVNNVMTNNAIIDPFVTNNVSVDQVPVMTNNLPVHPVSVVSNNVPVVSVMTNNAVSNPVVTKNVPVDPVSVMTNNVPVVPVVTNNVPVDPVVTNNVPIDPVITKTVVIDPVVTNHVQVDPALVDPVKMKTVPANPAVKSNVPIDPVVPVKPVVTNIVSVVSAVSNNALSNLATTNHVPANPAVTNNVPANLAVTNNKSVDPAVANNVPVNHVVTNNVPANPAVTKNVPANPTVTNNVPADPALTNNVPANPVVTNNVPANPTVTNNVPVNHALTNNVPTNPVVTNNVPANPAVTNNIPTNPALRNNIPANPAVTNNVPANPTVTNNVPVNHALTNNVPTNPVVTNNIPTNPVVTSNFPVNPAVTNYVPAIPVVTNNVQVDPVVINNAAIDPTATSNVPVHPVVANNVQILPIIPNNIPVQTVVTNNVPVDPVVANNVPVDPVVANNVPVNPALTYNVPANPAVTNNVPANPVVTNNFPANPVVTNNFPANPALRNNIPANPAVTNNIPADPVVTNNVPANSAVTNNIPVNPVVTNNVPATPVVINNVQVDPVVIKNVEIDPTATNNVPVDPVVANNVHILPIIPNNIPVQPVVTNNVSVDHVVTNNVPVNPASTYNFLANPAITNNIPAKPVLTSHVEVDPFLTNNVPIDSVVTNSVPVKPVVTNNVPVLPIRANNVPSESVVTNNYPANSVVANNFKVDPIVTNNYPIDHVVTNNVPVLPIRPNNLPVNIVVTNNVPVDPVVTNNVPVLPIRPNNNPVLPIQSNNVPIEAVVALVPSVSNNVPIASVHPVLPLDITNKTSVSHTDPGDPGALIKNKSPLAKTVIESIPIKPGAIINTGQLQPGGATSSSVLLPTAEVPFTQGQRDQLLALNTVADIVNNTTVNGSISPPENQQSSVAVQPNINQPPTATYPIVRGPIEALTKVNQQPVSPSLTTFNNLKPDHASKIAMLANTSEVVLTPNTKSRQINTTHTTYINKFTTVTNSPLADVFSVRQGQVFNPAALTVKASHSSVSNNQVTTSHSNHSEVFLQQHHNSSVPTVITTNNVERSKLNLSNHDNSRFVDVFAHTPVNTSTNTRRLTSNIFDSLLKQGHQLDYILKHTRNVPVWHSYTLSNGSVLTWITIDANSSTSQQVLDQTSNKRTTISTGASLGQISNAFDPVKPTGVFYHPTNAQPVAKATGKSQASTAQVGEQTVYNETGLLIDPELSHLEPNQVSNTSDATANNNRTVSNTTSTPHVVETPANEENIPTEVGIALVPEVGIVADQSPVLSSSLVDSPKEITEISSSKRTKVPNEVHSYSTATNHNTVTAETPKLKTSISQKNTDEVITSLKNLIQRHPSTTHTKRKYTSAEIKNLNKINPTRLLFTIADPMDSTTLPTTSTTVIPATSTVIDQTIHNTAISNNRKDPVGRNTQTSISFNEPTLSITLGKADSVSKPTTTQPSTSDSFNSKDFSELRSILASNGIKTAEELNQLLMKKSETENRQKLNSIAEHFTKTDNKCPSDKPCLWCRSSPAWSYVDGMSGWCMRNCKTQSCVHSRCKCKCVDDDEFSTLLQTIASSDLRGK